MQTLFNIGLTFVVLLAVLAIFGALFSGKRPLIDRLIFPDLNFSSMLSSNNVAVGIFLGAVALGICLIASRAVGAPLDRYDDAFRQQAHIHFGYEQDWHWFKAQGMTESRLDPSVCSQVGACGVMQFMPGTAVGMGLQNRFDAHESIRAGIAYDRQLWNLFSAPRPDIDHLAFVFSGYNWGAGNVIRIAQPCALKRFGTDTLFEHIAPCMPRETQLYFPRIREWRERFAGAR